MEEQFYHNLVQYLTSQQYPQNFNSDQQNQLKKQAKNFEIISDLLYKKNRNNSIKIRVIRKAELGAILYMFHNDPTAAHAAKDRMIDKMKSRYYWPQMYDDIKE